MEAEVRPNSLAFKRILMAAVVFCLLWHSTVAAARGAAHADSHEFYAEALALRSKLGASAADYDEAAILLLKAAGLKKDDLKPGSTIPHNLTAHRGVLRELAKALERCQGVPRNMELALRFFRRAAELGDPEAHGEMGVRYTYGLQDESTVAADQLVRYTKSDFSQALLHYSFVAFGNDTVSQLVLGHRHMAGHGVPQNCPTAVSYYNAAAERVIELGRMPGTLPYIEKVRLSVRSQHGLRSAREQQWLQFYQYSADMGDVDAQTAVGQLFNRGARGLQRDHQQALHYFSQAADAGDAGAMSHLGHMYANGHGVPKNNETALRWFRDAVDQNHPNGHYGLGYMFLAGYGIEQNPDRAAWHFKKAADLNHAEAQFHYGIMHLKGWLPSGKASPHQALTLFQAAAQQGHLLAMYNLAMMYLSGTGIEPNCQLALRLLKQVSEKGPWCQVLQEGHDAFAAREYSFALLAYLRAAQMGLELGQSNAAWMLEHGLGPGSQKENILLALQLYKSSSEQDYKESLLSIGDIHYYGRGVDKDWKEAAAVYRQAYNKKNARAAYNLGYMHEYGAGLPQDLHLAKRFYDLAQEYDPDGFYAAKLTVFLLGVHSSWNRIRPYVPQSLGSLIDWFFTLKYQSSKSVPTPWWSGRRLESLAGSSRSGFLENLMDFMDIDAIGDFFQDLFGIYDKDEVGDLVETLLLGLLVVIFMVVFRRRQTRGNQQARNTALRRPANGTIPQPGARGAGPQLPSREGVSVGRARPQDTPAGTGEGSTAAVAEQPGHPYPSAVSSSSSEGVRSSSYQEPGTTPEQGIYHDGSSGHGS